MSQSHANANFGGESSVSNRHGKHTATDEIPKDEFPSKTIYDRPPGWKLFLWNSQTKEFLGRNAMSWAKITIFYIVFFLFLAGFFTTVMIVFYSTLSDDRPKYTAKGGESLLSSPGLSMRPEVYRIIEYRVGDNSSYIESHIRSIDRFVQEYKETRENNTRDCTVNQDSNIKPSEKVCDFDISKITNLTKPNLYRSYSSGSPSVIIKLNKVFDWEPELIPRTSEKLPNGLRSYINETMNNSKVEMVWLWCNASDGQKITYAPQPGFPAFYYPFYGQKGYLAPLVVISVNNLKTGHESKVTCTAYAENIKNPTIQFTFSVLAPLNSSVSG